MVVWRYENKELSLLLSAGGNQTWKSLGSIWLDKPENSIIFLGVGWRQEDPTPA